LYIFFKVTGFTAYFTHLPTKAVPMGHIIWSLILKAVLLILKR